jgi:hypothetical protein
MLQIPVRYRLESLRELDGDASFGEEKGLQGQMEMHGLCADLEGVSFCSTAGTHLDDGTGHTDHGRQRSLLSTSS